MPYGEITQDAGGFSSAADGCPVSISLLPWLEDRSAFIFCVGIQDELSADEKRLVVVSFPFGGNEVILYFFACVVPCLELDLVYRISLEVKMAVSSRDTVFIELNDGGFPFNGIPQSMKMVSVRMQALASNLSEDKFSALDPIWDRIGIVILVTGHH